MSAGIKTMACTVTLAGGIAGALAVAVSMACMLMTLNNMMSTFIMMFDYLNGDPDAGEDLIDSATWNFVLSVGINAGGFAAKKTLQNILKSDLVRTIGTDCTERLMREFADVKDLSKYVKQILKMEISSGVIIEISEKFGKSGLDWIIGRKSVGLTDDLIRKIIKADSLDNFTDDVVKAIKNSNGYADDMVELVNRYGRDAGDAIAKYGDEAVEVLNDYGDEAVEGFKDGKTPDEVKEVLENINSSFAKKELSDVLKQLNMTVDEFNSLRLKDISTLTDAEKQSLKLIRESVPALDEDTMLQKVIPYEDIQKYLDGTYATVGGFVARFEDVSQLKTYDDIFEGLRLDYDGTKFIPETDESLGVVRYTTSEVENIKIPYGVEMGGTEIGGYPFTGNGFTSARNGQIIPEYKCEGYLQLEDGAQLIEIFKDGTEKLRAVYSKSQRKFIAVD